MTSAYGTLATHGFSIVLLGAALSGCAGVRSSTGTLTVSPGDSVVRTQEALAFEINGGQEPYSFEIIEGSGSVVAEAKSFVAPNTPSTSYVRIRDAIGRESVVVVKTTSSLDKGECAPLVLAVVDSGVNAENPELTGAIWSNPKEIPDNGVDDDKNGYVDDDRGWNFASETNDPDDDNYHGTHVAGAAAGVAGANRDPASLLDCQDAVKILPVKLFDAYGVTTSSDIVSSLRYAVDSGAQIINASFGARIYGSLPGFLVDTLAYVDSAGVPLVAAAGNYGQDLAKFPIFPASATNPNILTVAAVGPLDRLSSFSNYNAEHVDIAALGEFVESTFPITVTEGMRESSHFRTHRDSLSGTSVSSPTVAGALARLWAQNPDLTKDEIRQLFLDSADKVPQLSKYVGGGRVLRDAMP